MAPIKLVIFDCDGVLVDSEIIAARVESAGYRRLGLDMDAGEFAARFCGKTGEAIRGEIEAMLGRKMPDKAIEAIDADLKKALGSEVEAIAGVRETIERLGLPVCVCSNSSLEHVEHVLNRADFHDLFHPHLYSSRQICPQRPKPEPDIFRHAMAEFGVAPQATAILEDSVAGVRAGVAAGGRVIGFTGGRHTHAAHADLLSEAGAETVIRRHADLPMVIEALAAWAGVS
jgi:HAD superfamily hydrolase (TIGR01509 family)